MMKYHPGPLYVALVGEMYLAIANLLILAEFQGEGSLDFAPIKTSQSD